MSFSYPETFRPIGQILATDVRPALCRAQKLPLRVSCLGIAGDGSGENADNFDRTIPLGGCPSPEEAMSFAALRLSRGDICADLDMSQRFKSRIMAIEDRMHGQVLAGGIRADLILWQQPVSSDAEARRVVAEASRLRGMAFRASDPAEIRALRCRAAVLEVRLVDRFWRETVVDLLRTPHAA